MDYRLLLRVGSIICLTLCAFGVGHVAWLPVGLALFVGSFIP